MQNCYGAGTLFGQGRGERRYRVSVRYRVRSAAAVGRRSPKSAGGKREAGGFKAPLKLFPVRVWGVFYPLCKLILVDEFTP